MKKNRRLSFFDECRLGVGEMYGTVDVNQSHWESCVVVDGRVVVVSYADDRVLEISPPYRGSAFLQLACRVHHEVQWRLGDHLCSHAHYRRYVLRLSAVEFWSGDGARGGRLPGKRG